MKAWGFLAFFDKIDTNLRLYFEEDEVSLRESLGVLTHPVKTGDWILLVYENPAKIDDIIAPLMKDGYIMPVN